MASLFERLSKGFSGKQTKKTVDNLEEYKTKLKTILYDEELIEEFAPLFAKLSAHEGFDKVVELLETKEKQLESLTSTDWSQQDTDDEDGEFQEGDNDDEASSEDATTAESILMAKYSK